MDYSFLKIKIVQVVFLICASLGTIGFAYSESMSNWDAMPEHLKSDTGVGIKSGMIYSTSMVPVDNIRPDKAFEIARKKSLLRAIQMIQLFGSCTPEKFKLYDNDYQDFLSIVGTMVSQSHIDGLRIVRQWESATAAYSAVAVPAKALVGQACPYSSLDQVIEQYLSFGDATFDGLVFCLRYSPRYSIHYREALIRVGQRFRQNNMPEIAACFDGRFVQRVDVPQIVDLAAENRIKRADRLIHQAQGSINKEKWTEAMASVSCALDLVPTYGPAYLLAADYLHQTADSSTLAISAAKAALRTGTVYKEALSRLVTYLESKSDPEAQIFRILLDQSKSIKDDDSITWADHVPGGWLNELRRFKDDPLLNLVVVSLGNAVIGSSLLPAAEYQQAVELFKQASNDDDIERVIDMLLEACRKQPASAETYNLIGACFRHLHKYELALPFFWQALNLKPEYDLALVNLGFCCQALEADRSARYYFEYESVANSSNEWVRSSYEEFKESLSKK